MPSTRPAASPGIRHSRRLKRLIDVLVSACALFLAAPLMAAIALLIRSSMGAPVLFRQTRPGRGGRPFAILKFRTMRDPQGPDGRTLLDTQRLTRLGTFLRRTGLDELPELFNVLRGEMSLVGPRPLLMEYLDLYTHEEMRRHDVPPGITGWAQVHGRRSVDMPDRLRLDVWYVDHWSNALDLRIMARTIGTLLGGAGSETHDVVAVEGSRWGRHLDEVTGPGEGAREGAP
jgi:lipopolysaccharide/colanic/teichoic acid biosynthesis glycosyltransferase